MIAILGGLGAAAMWATATICSTRSSRLIGAGSALSWVMLVGVVGTTPVVIASGAPPRISPSIAGWLAVTGVSSVVGLLLEYRGLRVGKVGIVAPITSTEGAIAAILAVAAGEKLGAGAGAALAVVALGVVLASLSGGGSGVGGEPGEQREVAAALYGLGAALSFGVALYATAHVGKELPVAWVIMVARAIGAAVIALPLLVTSRLRLTRQALPFVVSSGICEVVGIVFFVVAARHDIAVSSVLASQFAALATLAAFILFRERLGRLQILGAVAILSGVAALTLLQG